MPLSLLASSSMHLDEAVQPLFATRNGIFAQQGTGSTAQVLAGCAIAQKLCNMMRQRAGLSQLRRIDQTFLGTVEQQVLGFAHITSSTVQCAIDGQHSHLSIGTQYIGGQLDEPFGVGVGQVAFNAGFNGIASARDSGLDQLRLGQAGQNSSQLTFNRTGQLLILREAWVFDTDFGTALVVLAVVGLTHPLDRFRGQSSHSNRRSGRRYNNRRSNGSRYRRRLHTLCNRSGWLRLDRPVISTEARYGRRQRRQPRVETLVGGSNVIDQRRLRTAGQHGRDRNRDKAKR
ncbi:integral membrane protein [Zymobacter palmae]|uniref:Integral membrane protein n=1 Tax=Zymobacter palmae TaxID=33074 RepID=A0A348HIF5_9GAMM|nr:integral membrane protein [Zymobacter palmae]